MGKKKKKPKRIWTKSRKKKKNHQTLPEGWCTYKGVKWLDTGNVSQQRPGTNKVYMPYPPHKFLLYTLELRKKKKTQSKWSGQHGPCGQPIKRENIFFFLFPFQKHNIFFHIIFSFFFPRTYVYICTYLHKHSHIPVPALAQVYSQPHTHVYVYLHKHVHTSTFIHLPQISH